jgi:hypothetical protein
MPLDLYDSPCEGADNKQLNLQVADGAMQLLGVIERLYDGLKERIDHQDRELAKVSKALRASLARRTAQNQKLLDVVVGALESQLATAISEGQATLNTVLDSTREKGSVAAAPAAPVSTGVAPGGLIESPSTSPPLPPVAAVGAAAPEFFAGSDVTTGAVDYLLSLVSFLGGPATATFASQQLSELSAGRLPRAEIPQGLLSHLVRGMQGSPTQAAPIAAPSQGDAGGGFGLPPVDLDQPLAMKFSPDDNPWKAQAAAFAGPWLQDFFAASSADQFSDSVLAHVSRPTVTRTRILPRD